MAVRTNSKDAIHGFGRHSGTDYNMLINIVYVLIGFMISTSEGFLTGRMDGLKKQIEIIPTVDLFSTYSALEQLISYESQIAEAWMFLTGSFVLICFLFYLAEYYEKIWVELFIQQKDKVFFRFYCILIGIYVILLKLVPILWPLFFSFLVSIMIMKKWSTRKEIRFVIDDSRKTNTISKRVDAIYTLADTMAYNFSVLGGISLVFIMSMTYLAFRFKVLWVLALCSLFSLLMCYFWLRKVQSGIDRIRLHVDEGNISDGAFIRFLS